jgi:hypothetical protein
MAETRARILIRRGKDGAYLQPDGQWTQARDTARAFENCNQAFFHASANELAGIEILFAFDPEQCYDFVALRI